MSDDLRLRMEAQARAEHASAEAQRRRQAIDELTSREAELLFGDILTEVAAELRRLRVPVDRQRQRLFEERPGWRLNKWHPVRGWTLPSPAPTGSLSGPCLCWVEEHARWWADEAPGKRGTWFYYPPAGSPNMGPSPLRGPTPILTSRDPGPSRLPSHPRRSEVPLQLVSWSVQHSVYDETVARNNMAAAIAQLVKERT